jgi:phosphatidylinositol 4-phosphatase
MSVFYSGTPAQKTDFTATGKRTSKGALNDGHASIKRYFLGNFYDSREQDIIDFSLGKLRPKQNPKEAIRHSSLNAVWVLLFVVSITLLR